MINPFQRVYTSVTNALKPKYGNIFTSVVNLSPTKFPTVSIVMIGNEANSQAFDLSGNENAVDADFEVNVFTATAVTATIDAQNIVNDVSERMRICGYRRTSYTPITMATNSARIVCRFSCKGANK